MIRANLLLSTALTVIALPAAAQPAANARPTGGQVVAGGAAISQTPSSTVITQSTGRAAINWQSFSVGSQQSVDFQQPSSSAVTLNRVTGPDPSAIAGKIHANGGVVLTNPNGVVFYKGAQVNAQDVIVSTAGITNQNFVAGRMVFDQPGNPDAKIANAGTITVKDTGLAALVAPQVANSGVISARLGHAVLAGAAAATLDMYGDGLLSVDVTKQVTRAPGGGAALVTNTGVIRADGGQVLLTAQAADGVVQNLVAAGGKIAADSVGAKTGSIAIEGTGGSIIITGHLSALGVAAGTTGGAIELNADQSVTVAAGARVNASGAAGGGTVAVGTNLARAIGGAAVTAPTAASTTIAKGAKITANATKSGNGGRVAVLSTQTTAMHGSIAAKGGPTAGNGGTVEISTGASLTLDGSIDVSAPHGLLGDILIDPYDLDITAFFSNTTLTDGTNPNLAYNSGGTTIGNNATITPAQIGSLHGNVHLQAVDDINVQSSVSLTTVGQGLTLEAGNNLTVNSGVTISTAGSIALLAASTLIPGFSTGGTLEMLGSVASTGGAILMQGGTGGVIVAGGVTAPAGSLVDLKGDSVSLLSGGSASLVGGSGGFVSVPGGQLTIEPYTAGQPIELIGSASVPTAGSLSISATELALVNAATLSLGNSTAGSITIGKSLDAVSLGSISTLNLLSAGTVAQSAGLTVGTLTGTVASFQPPIGGGTLGLEIDAQNAVGTIGNFSVGSFLQLIEPGPLRVSGSVSTASGGQIILQGSTITVGSAAGGTIASPGGIIDLFANAVTIAASGGSISATDGVVQLGNINGAPVQLIGAGDVPTPGYLSVTTGDLASITTTGSRGAGQLALASGSTIQIGNAGDAIDLSATAPTLNLVNYAEGVGSQNLAVIGAGALTVGTLIGGLTTTLTVPLVSASLTGANKIGVLGTFSTSGSLTLNDATALTVAGPVSAPGSPVTISDTAGAIAIVGNLTGSILNLASNSAISQSGGTLTATTLFAQGATLSLVGANAIANIGSLVATTGSLAFSDQTGVTLLGPVTAAGNASLATAGSLVIEGSLTTPGNLALAATSAISEATGGLITAGTLSGNAGAATSLTQPNRISSVGTFSSTGGFVLNQDTTALTIAGALSDTGSISLSTAGPIFLAGTVSAPTVSLTTTETLTALNSGSNPVTAGQLATIESIIQTGGGVTADVLSINAAAGVNMLPGTTNSIASLGTITATGLFNLNNQTPITVAGPAVIQGPTINAGSGNDYYYQFYVNTPGDLTVAAPITGAVVGLYAGGSLSEISGGSVTTGFLQGSAGNIALVQAANAIGEVDLLTSSANLTLSDGIPLRINGAVSAGAGDTLTINNDSLTLGASAALSAPGGTVALAPLNPGDAFTIGNATSLTTLTAITADTLVIGSTTAGTVTIATTSSNFDASSVGTLALVSGANVTETGPDGIIANVLTGKVANTASLTGANQISTLGSFTTGGNLFLTDSNPAATRLTIAGPLTTGNAFVTSTSPIVISGPVSGTVVTVATTGTASGTGGISETGAGAITASSLIATVASPDPASLAGANSVPAAVAAVGSGGFTLTDSTNLDIHSGNSLSATGPVVLNVAGTLSIDGAVGGTGSALSLTATGPIIESSSGTLAGSVLTGSASLVSLGQVSNTVGTLGAFTSTGGFLLLDGAGLTVAGPVTDRTQIAIGSAGALAITGALTAPSVTLETSSGGAISLAGSITATSGLALAAAGPVAQTGGAIVTPLLTGSGGGAVILNGTNTIAALGSFSAGGSFSLTDSGALLIGGTLAAPSVNLAASGAIGESGTAALVTSLLTGSATSASLPAAGNQVGAVGSFAAATGFSLTDAVPVTVSGTIAVNASRVISLLDDRLSFSAGGALSAPGGTIVLGPGISGDLLTLGGVAGGATTAAEILIEDSGPISITGALNLAGVSAVFLESAGAITESASGAIIAPLVTGAAASTALGGPNSIASLGSFSTTGAFALNDSSNLALAGVLSAPSATLVSGGTISEGSGAFITAGTFAGGANAAALSGANTIATLGSFTAATGLLLADATSLTVSGPVNGGLFAGIAVSGSLAIPGTVTGTSVSLSATGPVSESGAIAVASLAASGSNVALTGSNAIAGLGNVTATGGFQFSDTAPVSLTGTVAAGPSASFSGPGLVSEAAGGSLAATTLSVSVGTLALGGSNAIGTLASAAAPGGLLLNDSQSLVVTGPAGSSAGALTSLSAAGSIAITGSLAGGTVNLAATGAASEGGAGLINAGTLSGSFASAMLGGVNTIAALGSITTPATLSLAETGSLNVAGPVTAPGVALTLGGALTEGAGGSLVTGNLSASATGGISLGGANQITAVSALTSPAGVALTNAGNLLLTGPISGASVNLVSTGGALTQTGGTIATPLLTGSAATTASLTRPNTVGTLGAFSTGGVFTFNDGSGLTVAGPLSAGNLNLTAAGPIALAGTITTGIFTVSATSQIVQSAGTITASLLAGNATGAAVFGPDAAGPVANIVTLGPFAVSGGTLSVADGQPLNVQGPLRAPVLQLSAPGTITLSGGTIATNSGTITAPVIVQSGTTDVFPQGSGTPVLVLASSGSVSLSDLEAPAASLQLNTGSGTATGLLDVAALAVNGAGGSATLTGAVAGNGTQNAALISTITPGVSTNYTLNGCVIAAASCSLVIPPTPPPPVTPVPPQTPPQAKDVVESIVLPPDSGVSIVPDVLSSSDSASGSRSAFRVPFLAGLLAYVFSRDVDDPDLVLPNISDRDY